MIRIELTPYEKNDLVRMLEYTAERKKWDYQRGKITEMAYDDFLDKLFVLRKRIDGVSPETEILQKGILSELTEE